MEKKHLALLVVLAVLLLAANFVAVSTAPAQASDTASAAYSDSTLQGSSALVSLVVVEDNGGDGTNG